MPRFDVHAHFDLGTSSAAERAAAARAANFADGGPPLAGWSVERALAFMDARGIALQLLSLPADVPADRAREANDLAAAIVADHPERFGWLATVPLGEPDRALEEVRRAASNGADGFALVSNYGGRYLGDPGFDPVLREFHRVGRPVFVHPTSPPGFDRVALGRPGPLFEFPVDTARTVVDALFAGVLLRHDLRLVLAHAGGVLPTLSTRLLDLGTKSWVPNAHRVTGADLRAQLAALYLDTAIAGSSVSLGPAVELVGESHLVYGSDYPPAGEDVVDSAAAALDAVLGAGGGDTLDATFTTLFPEAARRAARDAVR